MKIIDELYKPTVAMLPIGDCLRMDPREAAYAVKNFLPTPNGIFTVALVEAVKAQAPSISAQADTPGPADFWSLEREIVRNG